jgi:hypothetical protein
MIYLRKIAKKNILLYRIWIFSRNDMSLPKKKDNWYFDGYPRSGNTFSKRLFSYIYKDLKGTSHLHSIAGLKIALKRNIRSIIIFRDPLESILSYAFTKSKRNKNPQKYDINLLKQLTEEWIDYYKFSIKNKENILLIEFKTNNEGIIINIKSLARYLKLTSIEDIKIKENIFIFNELMQKNEDKKESSYSSLPKIERNEFKKNIKSDLLTLESYKIASKIYDELVSISRKC